jgi:hypothetical protein
LIFEEDTTLIDFKGFFENFLPILCAFLADLGCIAFCRKIWGEGSALILGGCCVRLYLPQGLQNGISLVSLCDMNDYLF